MYLDSTSQRIVKDATKFLKLVLEEESLEESEVQALLDKSITALQTVKELTDAS